MNFQIYKVIKKIVLVTNISVSFFGFSQSKKEQIKILNTRFDSLLNVLKNNNSKSYNDIEFLNQEIKQLKSDNYNLGILNNDTKTKLNFCKENNIKLVDNYRLKSDSLKQVINGTIFTDENPPQSYINQTFKDGFSMEFVACTNQDEIYKLIEFNDLVERRDDKLFMKLENGQSIVLVNNQKITETVCYEFKDYIPELNSYFIDISYYEGNEYCLINKNTGFKLIIPGLFVVSPNKTHFVSYNSDIVARYSNNGFVIYRFENNKFIKEYDVLLKDWGPENARWINNIEIEFDKYCFHKNNYGIFGKINVEYKNKWKIKPSR
jgi:hypothetical protein